MDRQNFRIVASVAAMAAALPVCSGSAAEAKRPNVIVMIADDLGYGDVSCLMRSVVATPNLDRLAKDGVKFTAGYASCPLCAPSRNGFLTGRYQERFGSMNNATFTIPREVPVFSEIFRKAGYTTGLLGKWHSGDKPGFRPFERGFQEFYGYYGPFLNYREPRLYRNDAAKPVAEREYSTDAFAREAEEFIERHKGEPFFLNVAFNAPHIPRVIKHAGEVLKMFEEHPEEFKRKGPRELKDYMSRPGEDQKYLAQFDNDWGRADTVACITALDQAVGRILDKLHQTALDRRTIVFFFSDNGGHPENRSENLPLYGYKWSTYEGGIRVPFFASYPGVLPSGLRYREPVMTIDILPTCAALTGTRLPGPTDGVDLTSYLCGQNKTAPHQTLYWRIDAGGRHQAIRQGPWKLVMNGNQPPRLFAIDTDFEEKHDMAAGQLKVVEELQAAWQRWNASMCPARLDDGRIAPEPNNGF